MKRVLLITTLLIISGCSSLTAPKVTMNWPDTPPDLKTACPDLKLVPEDTAKLSELLKIVSDNYSEYYSCKDKVDNWIEWYNNQQKIYNSVK